MDIVVKSFKDLQTYCEAEEFKGWDPYDGLNSKVFKVTGLQHWDLARLIWIQGFKRSPFNFRKLLAVPKEYNSKGIGLFLSGYCNLYKIARNGNIEFGTSEELLEKIVFLANLLLGLQNKDYSGACWGYNFDWQSKAFFLPAETPTVVATSFVVEALIEAYEITRKSIYFETAVSAGKFITNDLNRIQKENGEFMFSYSPLDNRAVYNASLLGAKTLSLIYHYTKEESYKKLAHSSIKSVCRRQNKDGSFPHSDQVGQKWRDNFHTGFKLESIAFYKKYCKDDSFDSNLEKGFYYWSSNYFDTKTGFAYYYDRGMDSTLVDLHCAGQALSTLDKLDKFKSYHDLADKIIRWSIENMQSPNGFFYFQRKGNALNKTQYLRWPNAWMFYGMSYYLLNINTDD